MYTHHCSAALQEASYRGHADVVRPLLEAGADVNADAGDFGSRSQAAVNCGQQEVAKVLKVFAMAGGNKGTFKESQKSAYARCGVNYRHHAYCARMHLPLSCVAPA